MQIRPTAPRRNVVLDIENYNWNHKIDHCLGEFHSAERKIGRLTFAPTANELFDTRQKLRRRHSEAVREIEQRLQRWALFSSFELADVIAVVTGRVRERILGIPVLLP